MKSSRGILIVLTMAFCGALTWSGCGGGNAAAKAEPQVVRKKIVANAKPPAAKTGGSAILQPKSAVAETRAPAKVPQIPQSTQTPPDIRPKSDVAATPQSSSPGAAEIARRDKKPAATAVNTLAAKEPAPVPHPPAGKAPSVEPPDTVKSKSESPKIAMATVPDKPGLPPLYDPKDKIDPFEPLFKEEPEMPETASKRPKRIPRTPLEKIALSQLKLVGIITAASGNRALVQESSGKGYIIKTGTYIGTNAGKVVEIDKEKVVVEEEFTDIVGNLQLRKKEIFLPKPSGE